MDPSSRGAGAEPTGTKVVALHRDATGDLVPRLERMLEMAKSGEITDLVAVYFDKGYPSYTVSYSSNNRMRLIGLLEVIKLHLCELVSVE